MDDATRRTLVTGTQSTHTGEKDTGQRDEEEG